MKNGFTLIELLGVIVIITTLSLIAVPIIDRSLNESRDKLFETQKTQLIKSLKDYYADVNNMRVLNKLDVSGDSLETSELCTSLSDLKSGGFLPADVKNPKTGKAFDNEATVSVCVKKICEHDLVLVKRDGINMKVCAVDSNDEVVEEVLADGSVVRADYDLYRNNWKYKYFIKIGSEVINE